MNLKDLEKVKLLHAEFQSKLKEILPNNYISNDIYVHEVSINSEIWKHHKNMVRNEQHQKILVSNNLKGITIFSKRFKDKEL